MEYVLFSETSRPAVCKTNSRPFPFSVGFRGDCISALESSCIFLEIIRDTKGGLLLKIRNRYDKNGNLIPADYQVEELPEDLYELLSEVYARRLKELEERSASSGKPMHNAAPTP